MSLRSRLLQLVRRGASMPGKPDESTSASLQPTQPLAGMGDQLGCSTDGISLREAVEKIIPLTNKVGDLQAGLFSYSIEQSKQIIERLRQEELYGTGSVETGMLSPQIGDAVSGLSPIVLAGLRAGQLYQVIGPASVVEGFKQGTMRMVEANSGGLLGIVTQQGASQFVGQARFTQMSATSVVAPLMVYQAVHMVVGTQQINQINRRLAGIERTLERIVQRQNAKDLGEVIAASSTLRDILQEHQHSGRFNSQMRDRLSHCERDLRAHLERMKLLKSQFHGKLKAAQSKLNNRDRAIQLAILIKEEGEQFGQDIRLLIALSGAVMQLEQGLMAIALEHHPESIQYRQKQIQLHMESCQDTLRDMINLSEVQGQIRVCLDEMNWWQKILLDRSGASALQQATNLQLGDFAQPSGSLNTASSGSMLVWMDPSKGIQVRAIAAGEDNQNDEITEASFAGWPEPKYVALAPSTSLRVGEIYRLNMLNPSSTEGWAKRDVPIRILQKTGDRKWIGTRMDVAEIEHVEILLAKD